MLNTISVWFKIIICVNKDYFFNPVKSDSTVILPFPGIINHYYFRIFPIVSVAIVLKSLK